MKLFIADDNAQFRNRLIELLSTIEHVEIVGSAENAPASLASIEHTLIDAVILDIHMTGGSGLDILPAMRSARPDVKILMLTVGQRNEYEARCIALGADYFFNKARDMKKMIRTIRRLAREIPDGEHAGTVS